VKVVLVVLLQVVPVAVVVSLELLSGTELLLIAAAYALDETELRVETILDRNILP
jgi:hypothetical protein